MGNNTPEALSLLERIKEGYEPNERDVFVIIHDNEAEIKTYCKMYDIRKRVSKGLFPKTILII